MIIVDCQVHLYFMRLIVFLMILMSSQFFVEMIESHIKKLQADRKNQNGEPEDTSSGVSIYFSKSLRFENNDYVI